VGVTHRKSIHTLAHRHRHTAATGTAQLIGPFFTHAFSVLMALFYLLLKPDAGAPGTGL
jgi:hypothetical protein